MDEWLHAAAVAAGLFEHLQEFELRFELACDFGVPLSVFGDFRLFTPAQLLHKFFGDLVDQQVAG
jgi:hypothetical protein